ncbi:Pentatricopeptide repeat-containing protein, mitochondrial [Ananas comosus]|uniref:Pentatricopeptide repeat-containing protein, mitochondrial n=1 Tax=Ananas comosus TaxID=4615 RepID=A0A199VFV9_ANACO|nr:Pentatricopeptide repeat-containing protein, mitochondrial [Ananas comosus]
MATGSLIAALLRGARHRNPSSTILLRPLPLPSHLRNPRLLSSSPSPSGGLDIDDADPPAAAVENDDLRSRIFRLRFAKRSATAALERWAGEGRSATAVELRQIARDLRRSHRYKHALEISEWMKTHHELELSESDYGLRIDLITKVFGANAAEDFFEGLPASAKSHEAYTALLHSFARAKLTEKAEGLLERMKLANICPNLLAYNEMMTLYTSVGQLDKVLEVVEELKREKLAPDLFTYNLWISACAATMDIDGVQRVLNEMAHDSNSEKGWITYMKLADIYVTAGHLVSSDNSLVGVDTKISQSEWITYDFLMILYAGLGNSERIREIWKSMHMTSQKMSSRNYICVLSSYLMLGQLKDAGEVIDQWRQSKSLEFDISACNRLFDAFMKADLIDVADKFRELMLQKSCELTRRPL